MYLFNLFWHSSKFNSVCQTAVENVKEGIDFSCLTATIFLSFFFFFLQLFLLRKISLMGYSYHAIVIT